METNKNIFVIEGRKLFLNGIEKSFDDLYDKSFYDYSNSVADSYYNETYGVNEIFINVVQDYLAIDFFVKNNKQSILLIDAKKAETEIQFFLKDIAKKYGIAVKTKEFSWVAYMLNYSAYHFASFLYLLYLMARLPYKSEKIEVSDKFSVLRYQAQFTRTRNFPDIQKEMESPYDKDSIYRLFTKRKRIKWVCHAYLSSFGRVKTIRDCYKSLLGGLSSSAVYGFYKKRIVHTELYYQLIDNYFPFFSGKEYYSSYNLDRFSVIEDELAHKYSIKTYNLPHGLEYGFKMPKGFSSDIFYALTSTSANFLNEQYHTNKFVYDADVVIKLMKKESTKTHPQYVVYFTEPREVYVNVDIIKGIMPTLKKFNIPFFVKLHQGDKKENYKDLGLNYLSDFTEAISGNICVSRKSTILLEAAYNESIPIAVITNIKDKTTFNNFPSLQSDMIVKTYSIDELLKQILEKYEK